MSWRGQAVFGDDGNSKIIHAGSDITLDTVHHAKQSFESDRTFNHGRTTIDGPKWGRPTTSPRRNRHRSRINKKRSVGASQSATTDHPGIAGSAYPRRCKLCKVRANNQSTWDIHINGKRHREQVYRSKPKDERGAPPKKKKAHSITQQNGKGTKRPLPQQSREDVHGQPAPKKMRFSLPQNGEQSGDSMTDGNGRMDHRDRAMEEEQPSRRPKTVHFGPDYFRMIHYEQPAHFDLNSAHCLFARNLPRTLDDAAIFQPLFWGFGDGEKYITFHHDFDGHSWASDKSVSGIWIYPACEGPLAEGNISTVLQDSSSYDDEADYAIRDALAGGDRTGWHRLTTEQNEGNWWPVTFEITNDISSHLVNFTFTTAKLSVSCIYYDSFAVNTSFVAGLQPDVSAGSADDIHIDYVAVDSYATPSIPSTSVLHSETSLVC